MANSTGAAKAIHAMLDRASGSKRVAACAIVALVLAAAGSVRANEWRGPLGGEKPPRTLIRSIQPDLAQLRRALALQDAQRAHDAVARLVAALGAWAGAPEAKRPYYRPIEASKPDIQAVWRLWEAIERRTKPLWETVPDGDPLRMKTGLRAACRPMLAYLQVARLDPAKGRRYRDMARKGAEYLLRLQREDGLFPFPDLRGRHRKFGPMIQRMLRRHPTALQAGWIIDDEGDGGLQYDQGICGVAMIEMYEHGKEEKYLESARRAADWAAGRPAVTNWNYNAFSLWLLARFARATGEAKYLLNHRETLSFPPPRP